MDVTCERCSTEYEFDETLVSDRGTTVKCTNCGHLFKVYRQGEAGETGSRSWEIRKQDGTGASLGSLRELQKLITRGELTEDDEISRSGEAWKPLGSIAELQTFFAAAQAGRSVRGDATSPFPAGPFQRTASGRPAPDERAFANTLEMESHPGGPPFATPRVPASALPSAPPPKRTILGPGAAPPAPRPQSAPPAPPPPVRAAPSSAPPPASAMPARAAAATAGERPRAIPPTQAFMDDDADTRPDTAPPARVMPSSRPPAGPRYVDEQPARTPRRSRTGLWIALVLVIAAGVGIGLGWNHIGPALGLAPADDPAAAFLSAGDEALAQDDVPGYQLAIREYTRATALNERDIRTLTALARAHALLAQALDFEAGDLSARAAADPALAGEAVALRRDERANGEQARRYAEDAVRQDPNNVPAVIALCDALRLTGDQRGARSHLDRARTLAREPSADLLRALALLEAAEAGELGAGLASARQAVETDPALIRARLVYARSLLATGDVAEARSQIEAILGQSSSNSRALHLKDAIERGLPPAAPVVEVVDAAVPPDAGAPAEPTPLVAPPIAEPGTVREPPTPPGPEAVPGGRDYSWYLSRGEQALERGDTVGARAFLDAALTARPGGSEALAALGRLDLNAGNASAAIAHFRPAAQAGYANAYIGLGQAYRRMGRLREAVEAYQGYLNRYGSTGPQSALAQSQIRELTAQLEGQPEAPTPPNNPPNDLPGPTPQTPPDSLPAPRGTDPANPPPASDPPAVGSEYR